MPKYVVVLSNKAQKKLDKLSDKVAELIFDAIGKLEENPRPHGYIKLQSRKGYRIRAGNYRIIYDIFDSQLIIEIITLGHRKEIYE